MPNDVERARDEQLMAAFAVILTHPLKFEISLRGELWIERLPTGQFRILQMQVGGKQLDAAEEIFEPDDIRSAIGYFLDVAEGRAGMLPAPQS